MLDCADSLLDCADSLLAVHFGQQTVEVAMVAGFGRS